MIPWHYKLVFVNLYNLLKLNETNKMIINFFLSSTWNISSHLVLFYNEGNSIYVDEDQISMYYSYQFWFHIRVFLCLKHGIKLYFFHSYSQLHYSHTSIWHLYIFHSSSNMQGLIYKFIIHSIMRRQKSILTIISLWNIHTKKEFSSCPITEREEFTNNI